MKTGYLGGTFDPVHKGHLHIAREAALQFGLGKVVFVPSARNPLKGEEPESAAADRLAMLKLALKGESGFEIDDLELRRGGLSFTCETVRILRERHPGERIFWIIGADQVEKLPKWKAIGELVRMVEFISLPRSGSAPVPPSLSGLRLHSLRMRNVKISATEIRKRMKNGLPVNIFLDPAVIDYIKNYNLYR